MTPRSMLLLRDEAKDSRCKATVLIFLTPSQQTPTRRSSEVRRGGDIGDLEGPAKAVNELVCGGAVAEIVKTVAITAIQRLTSDLERART